MAETKLGWTNGFEPLKYPFAQKPQKCELMIPYSTVNGICSLTEIIPVALAVTMTV